MTPTMQESGFLVPCWRCCCAVPNGLVQRRAVKIGWSTGRYGQDYYQTVNLCGICVQQIEEEARARGRAQAKAWGFIIGLIILTVAGLRFPVSLLIMCMLAWGIHRHNKKHQSVIERSNR